MVRQNVEIINPSGLHLRPAVELAKLATTCSSKVSLIYQDKTANAKSSLNIMALVIKKGSKITIVCEGDTEQQDLQKMVDFIKNGAGELE